MNAPVPNINFNFAIIPLAPGYSNYFPILKEHLLSSGLCLMFVPKLATLIFSGFVEYLM